MWFDFNISVQNWGDPYFQSTAYGASRTIIVMSLMKWEWETKSAVTTYIESLDKKESVYWILKEQDEIISPWLRGSLAI